MPDAPAWLREAFKDGVDDREMVYRDGVERFRRKGRSYAGANPWCWLAQFDPKRVPCGGQPGKVIERFHFIGRQRVEAAMWEALREARILIPERRQFIPLRKEHRDELIRLAAWDPRNGGLGCELHHRRFDSHADSPGAPKITVPAPRLPLHVVEFVADRGLETTAADRFPGFIVPDETWR